jgi:predicted ATPase
MLRTFPRECKPLLGSMFQKMTGNTIFVHEFLRSLAERGLLEYDAGKRCWVWDEDHISAVDVTANVHCLLSSNRSELSETTSSALKVAVCFGVINELIIEYLSNKVMS